MLAISANCCEKSNNRDDRTYRHPNALLIQPLIFVDGHGFFFENFNERVFAEKTGVTAHFVQDNHPLSECNLLRGFCYKTNRALI